MSLPWMLLRGLSQIRLVGSPTSLSDSGSLSLPAGLAEGDIVIVGWSCDNTLTLSLPSGWNPIYLNAGGAPSVRMCYKFMGSSPDSSITIPTDTGGAKPSIAFAFRGVNLGTPFDTTTLDATGASGDPDSPSITTVTARAVVMSWGFLDDDVATLTSGPSGYSDSTLQTGSSGASSNATTMAAWKEVPVAGAENPGAWNTSGDDEWVAVSLALRPA